MLQSSRKALSPESEGSGHPGYVQTLFGRTMSGRLDKSRIQQSGIDVYQRGGVSEYAVPSIQR